MNEHEKLKWICDQIEYSLDGHLQKMRIDKALYGFGILGVREIIFTQEFINRLEEYIDNNLPTFGNVYWTYRLLENLDNPVEYLHNLILNMENN